jgi:putative Holliday junction resolvase
MKVIAVDPGDQRIGIAISDLTGTIANPLTIIKHVSRQQDAAAIIELAAQHQADLIIIGQALDDEGMSTTQSRKAARLASVIKKQTNLPVRLWDESGSTDAVQQALIKTGATKRRRRRHLDDLAATYILQSFLDNYADNSSIETQDDQT